MKDEQDAEQDAKIEFLKAINKVQGLLEPVATDSLNPHFQSRYASLAAVNGAVMGPLTEAGFVLMSGGVDINGKPYLRTVLAHTGGYSVSFEYPIINDGNPQHTASSISYARRYAICSLLNLSVEDDDGTAAAESVTAKATEPVNKVFAPKTVSGNTISPAQAKRFFAIARGAGHDVGAINSYLSEQLGITRTEHIPRARYEEAVKWAQTPFVAKENVLEEVPF